MARYLAGRVIRMKREALNISREKLCEMRRNLKEARQRAGKKMN